MRTGPIDSAITPACGQPGSTTESVDNFLPTATVRTNRAERTSAPHAPSSRRIAQTYGGRTSDTPVIAPHRPDVRNENRATRPVVTRRASGRSEILIKTARDLGPKRLSGHLPSAASIIRIFFGARGFQRARSRVEMSFKNSDSSVLSVCRGVASECPEGRSHAVVNDEPASGTARRAPTRRSPIHDGSLRTRLVLGQHNQKARLVTRVDVSARRPQ